MIYLENLPKKLYRTNKMRAIFPIVQGIICLLFKMHNYTAEFHAKILHQKM